MEREQVLEWWIRQYGTAVLRTCFAYLSDVNLAEDAMQETFLKAWRHMDQYPARNGASEKTWLMHVAMNVCRDMRRSRWMKHIDMSRALEDIPQRMYSVLPEERGLLLDIMALPDKYKQLILLYYYQDMTMQETAQALGLSTSAVHHRLRKAESLLKLSLTGGECYDG